jgi:3,4-dihydroxy-2-butanone 4-phosphate synthase
MRPASSLTGSYLRDPARSTSDEDRNRHVRKLVGRNTKGLGVAMKNFIQPGDVVAVTAPTCGF